MSSISKVHTACKNCVFAIYNKITQTGCALGYIDKYKTKDAQILEVYDNEKEFYVINDKKCLGYRENTWFAKYGIEHADLQTKTDKFKELNHLDYLIMIDLKNFTIQDLVILNESIKECSIAPSKIVFIRYQTDNRIFTYDKIKDFFQNSKINCKWRIQTMVTDELSHEDILHNCCNLNKGYRFMLSIKNPCSNICSIIETTNKIVYDNLDQITAVCNKDKSAILFSAPTYRWSIAVEQKNILDNEDNYITV